MSFRKTIVIWVALFFCFCLVTPIAQASLRLNSPIQKWFHKNSALFQKCYKKYTRKALKKKKDVIITGKVLVRFVFDFGKGKVTKSRALKNSFHDKVFTQCLLNVLKKFTLPRVESVKRPCTNWEHKSGKTDCWGTRKITGILVANYLLRFPLKK